MHKSRHRARILSGSKSSNGRKWRMNVCVLAGSFLLLGAVALLQLQLTIVGEHDVQQELGTVNDSRYQSQGRDGKSRSWTGKGIEFSRSTRENTQSFDNIEDVSEDEINGESYLSNAVQTTVGEGERFDDIENDMDMEDDDIDEFGGDSGDRVNEVDEFTGNIEAESKDLSVKQEDGIPVLKGGMRAIDTGSSGKKAAAATVYQEGLETVELLAKDGTADASEKSGLGPTLFKPTISMSQSMGHTDLNMNGRGRKELRKLKEDGIIRDLSWQGEVRGAFNTDDEPINKDTRDRVEQMLNIEDALMINVGASSKKESWGKIEDGKTSKKERKVSSDPLNPANNPLLQDPDTFGEGILTQNDRALLKSVRWFNAKGQSLVIDQNAHHLNVKQNKKVSEGSRIDEKEAVWKKFVNRDYPLEFKHRGPDLGILSLPTEEGTNKSDEQLSKSSTNTQLLQPELEHMVNSSSTKPRGHYTLTDNMIGKAKTDAKASQGRSVDKKALKKGHKMNPKGEKRRWASFPGLHSQLSFAGFMEDFLFDKTCTLRVFMVWMTPAWSFTVRHQRVLESLLHFHPRACVVVFSETIELQFFKDFVDNGYRVAVVMPDLEELLKDTPAHVFSAIWMEWRQVDLFYIHYSELLRLAALYNYGGVYVDFDMLILKPLTNLNNTIGSEYLSNGQLRPNGAVMVLDRLSPFLNLSMAEFTATYDETLRDWNGAALMDRVVNAPPDDHYLKLNVADKIHVEPPVSFFPLSSTSISRYFFTPSSAVRAAEEEDLLNKILLQSFTVHLWNGLTSALIPEPGSLVDKLMERNCLHCIDIL